jgi:hypothetical protein
VSYTEEVGSKSKLAAKASWLRAELMFARSCESVELRAAQLCIFTSVSIKTTYNFVQLHRNAKVVYNVKHAPFESKRLQDLVKACRPTALQLLQNVDQQTRRSKVNVCTSLSKRAQQADS